MMSTLVRTEQRLLRGAAETLDYAAHVDLHGPVALASPQAILAAIDASGITGRGGAGFPTGRKLRSLADTLRPVVIGNGCEGEPASGKDAFLLRRTPHLVLDGLQVVAHAVGSSEIYLGIASPAAMRAVELALAERVARRVDPVTVRLVRVVEAFLSGEESALVGAIENGRALPRTTPPRVFERGAFGRPTLVQNVETLAHIALIARYGAGWFRENGTDDDPGTMLVSVSGAVRSPGVAEVDRGASVTDIVAAAGGFSQSPQAVLLGGYHGTWIDPAAEGFAPGAGVVVVLPKSVCGLQESARVVTYLAAQSAGQCGPCLNGLPALAQVFRELTQPNTSDPLGNAERAWRLASVVERRGACHHPDGTAKFVRSALSVFSAELDLHAQGGCGGTSAGHVLPTPGVGGGR